MKRRYFEKYLASKNCFLCREGASHSIFKNMSNGAKSPVPRHREINNFTVVKICSDFKIPKPNKF